MTNSTAVDVYSKIPEELKQLKQWCGFRLEPRGKKMTKIPVDANTGGPGKSNDENTWSDFKTALEAKENLGLSGLGFYFKEPYFGIDIDDVFSEIQRYKMNDTEDNIVAEFIETMQSYAEYSVSGTGIHILVKGKLPKGGRRKGNVEMYDSGRFFVMTGNIASEYKEVTEDTEHAVNHLHSKYIKKKETNPQFYPPNLQEVLNLSENDIIDAALRSKNAKRFEVFLNGGWESFYSSQSEAEMAFANDLAFWTGRDFSKMDSIFRSSSLMREKWDGKRKDSTYGADTLSKAIAECTSVYQPREKGDDFQLHVIQDGEKKKEKKFHSYDDTGNAERFVNHSGEHIRYSYTNKNWYYYDDKVWVSDDTGEIKRKADEVVQLMKKEDVFISNEEDEEEALKAFNKHVKYSRSNRGKASMLKEAEHHLPITPGDFDRHKELFNVQNGYLDLITGELKEHDKNKLFTKISNTEYTDKIDCPRWLEFLDEIFGYDQELIDFIQKAVGYSLTGSTREQSMFILFGNGRNGKSVFLDIINDIMGSYSVNIQPQTLMVKQQSGGANSDIARLDGARLVTTTEPNDGVRLDEGLVKQLTGGDKVTARHLYGNEFEFDPEFKIWMATNHKPIIRGTDDGIWRRLRMIPFDVQIPDHKVDKNLKHKLRKELTAILNWAVEGVLKWQEEGLKNPKVVEDANREYRVEMDSTEQFIQECCEIDEESRTASKVLYQTYREWARENGQYEMNHTKFGKEMSMKFQKIKSNGVKYIGVKLNDEVEQKGFTMSY